MDEKLAELFGLAQKNLEGKVWAGDDLKMGSVSDYGIPSGLAEIDLYLGCRGGYPSGKVIEMYGKPMCGKTTAALAAAAEWQKHGGAVMFIDTEHSFSPARARSIGCKAEDIIKSEADSIEEVFTHIDKMMEYLEKVKFDKPFLFIVDSITGVPTDADSDTDINKAERVGFEAKQIRRGVKKLNPKLTELECQPSIIFINHSVAKIGGFGKQSDSGGGYGIKFYASVRLEFIGIGNIKDKPTDRRLGQKIAVSIEKLKGGELEYPKFNLDLLNEIGFDRYESLKLAMIASGFAHRPEKSRTVTLLPGTAYEHQAVNKDWRDFIEQNGGYDAMYHKWRKWAVNVGVLKPWGGSNA